MNWEKDEEAGTKDVYSGLDAKLRRLTLTI